MILKIETYDFFTSCGRTWKAKSIQIDSKLKERKVYSKQREGQLFYGFKTKGKEN